MFCISEPFKETLVPSIWTNTVFETSSVNVLVTSPFSELTTNTPTKEIYTTEEEKVTTRSFEVTPTVVETVTFESTTEVHGQTHKTNFENSTPSTNTELITTVETEANITSKIENESKERDFERNIFQNKITKVGFQIYAAQMAPRANQNSIVFWMKVFSVQNSNKFGPDLL